MKIGYVYRKTAKSHNFEDNTWKVRCVDVCEPGGLSGRADAAAVAGVAAAVLPVGHSSQLKEILNFAL